MERNAHGARAEVYARVEGIVRHEKRDADKLLGKLLPQLEVQKLRTKRYRLRYAILNTTSGYYYVCCVCVFSSHSFWTSSSLDVQAGVTQEEGHTGFLIHLLSAVRALIFLARRIQPFLSLVNCEVEFCVLTI